MATGRSWETLGVGWRCKSAEQAAVSFSGAVGARAALSDTLHWIIERRIGTQQRGRRDISALLLLWLVISLAWTGWKWRLMCVLCVWEGGKFYLILKTFCSYSFGCVSELAFFFCCLDNKLICSYRQGFLVLISTLIKYLADRKFTGPLWLMWGFTVAIVLVEHTLTRQSYTI